PSLLAIPQKPCHSKQKLLRPESPRAFRFTCRMAAGWTSGPWKKFKWALGRSADMKSCGQAFLSLLFIFSTILPSPAQKHEQTSVDVSANVSTKDLLARPVGENWTSYNGDYTGQRYSSLSQINTENVSQLRAEWVFHPGNSLRLEATPLVVNGVMYVTAANDAFALDARTG